MLIQDKLLLELEILMIPALERVNASDKENEISFGDYEMKMWLRKEVYYEISLDR